MATMMSRILVPVDFTLICHNAYRYALHLAEDLDLDVVLVHYYSGSIDPRSPLVIAGDGTIQGSQEERLRQFAYASAEEPSYPLLEPPCNVAVTYEVEPALRPAAAITRRAAAPDISLVVLPPRSSGSLLGKWLGSTATTVSETCDRPVYLVPPEARYRRPRQVVVADNKATADPYPLWQLEELTVAYGARVHFVHVEKPARELALRYTPWPLMEELLEAERDAELPFEVVTVEDKDISQGLLDYADTIDADLLVIINQTRGHWQAVLRASLTQDLTLRSSLPVLVLHVARTATPAGSAGKQNKSMKT